MGLDLISATLGVACGMSALHSVRYTQEHRRQPAGVIDLLLWGFVVDDGVVLQKDGSLMAAWTYRGPDLDAATPEELSLLSQHLNDALLPLADTWMFHVDAIRRPAVAYPESSFPNAVTAMIDAERRAAYTAAASAHFETTYVLAVTYLPPPEVYDRLAHLFVRGSTTQRIDWGTHLASFHIALSALEGRLSTRLRLERLDSNRLVTHLHRCLTALDHPVHAPPHGAYLDSVLADQDVVGGFEPRVGQQHLRIIAIDGYPAASSPGLLDVLNRLPFAYRWSHRMLPLGRHTADKMIRRHQLNWWKKRKGAGTWLREMAAKETARTHAQDDVLFGNQHAQSMAEDAAQAATENASGAVRFCVYNQLVIVAESLPERVQHIASEITKALHECGVTARVETVNALDAWLGSLPGHGAPNVRRPLLNTANVVDLMPTTSVWPGLAQNPSPYFPPNSPALLWAQTEGATPFRVNVHDSDVGHTLIVGKTGAGKSTLVGLLTAQFQRYPNARILVFDVGYSGWLLAAAAGAPHYDIRPDRAGTLAFQPLAQIDDPGERTWAAEWLETVVALQGITVNPVQRTRIDRALTLLASVPVEHRTITELTVHLQDQELVTALHPYTLAGQYGLLDGTREGFQFGAYQVFELRHLAEMDDKIVVPVLLYLLRRVEQQLDGRPTLIILEELWAALTRSAFAARIKQWLLTLRKQNAALVLVAHSLAQLAALPDPQLITESCPTRIFLPNAEAGSSRNAALYHDLGLTDREISIIAHARPKRDYYFTSPRGSRLFELGLGPATLAFLATAAGCTIDETRQRAEAYIHQYGSAWPAQWLTDRGLAEWAAHYTHHTTSISHPPESLHHDSSVHSTVAHT
jgi:type IV secretion system protein VirB4